MKTKEQTKKRHEKTKKSKNETTIDKKTNKNKKTK